MPYIYLYIQATYIFIYIYTQLCTNACARTYSYISRRTYMYTSKVCMLVERKEFKETNFSSQTCVLGSLLRVDASRATAIKYSLHESVFLSSFCFGFSLVLLADIIAKAIAIYKNALCNTAASDLHSQRQAVVLRRYTCTPKIYVE